MPFCWQVSGFIVNFLNSSIMTLLSLLVHNSLLLKLEVSGTQFMPFYFFKKSEESSHNTGKSLSLATFTKNVID